MRTGAERSYVCVCGQWLILFPQHISSVMTSGHNRLKLEVHELCIDISLVIYYLP